MTNEEEIRRGGGNFNSSELERIEDEAERYRDKEIDEPITCSFCNMEPITPNNHPFYKLRTCSLCYNELEEINDQEACLKASRLLNKNMRIVYLVITIILLCAWMSGVLLVLLIQSFIR